MRSKEEAHDYRYFPDPDLLPIIIDSSWVDQVRQSLPELPQARCARFTEQYGLSSYDADVLTASRQLADYFEETARCSGNPKGAANWVMGELTRAINDQNCPIEHAPITPAQLSGLIALIDKGTINGTIAKKVFDELWLNGGEPAEIVERLGLAQVSDTAPILEAIAAIMAANQSQVDEYRSGKEKVFGFFVGQVMRAMKGKANPAVVNDLLKEQLTGP